MINKNSSPHNSMEGDLPLLISANKAAETLGVSARTLWTLTRAGTIPHVRFGRRVMYTHNSLQR
jgi:excisionase family DNA binding protein